MDRYKNKYRIPSARAQWWDYGWNGAYFITICTKNREHFFGEIRNGKMELSPLGVIADILWHEIPHHAPYVELGDFVVMPNHIHGILILNKPVDADGRADMVGNAGADGRDGDERNDNGRNNDERNNDERDDDERDERDNVETGHALSLPESDPNPNPNPHPHPHPYQQRIRGQ